MAGPALAAPRLLVLGNSVLHGVGASSPSAGCAVVAASRLNAALGGESSWVGGTYGLLAKLDSYGSGATPRLVLVHSVTHDLDLLALCADADDACSGQIASIVDTTVTICRRLTARWPGVTPLVLGPWMRPPGDPLDVALAGGLAGSWPYLSLGPVWARPGLLSASTANHPNDAGHAAIADGIVRLLPTMPTDTPTITPTPTVTPTPTITPTPRPIPTLPPQWARALLPQLGRRSSW